MSQSHTYADVVSYIVGFFFEMKKTFHPWQSAMEYAFNDPEDAIAREICIGNDIFGYRRDYEELYAKCNHGVEAVLTNVKTAFTLDAQHRFSLTFAKMPDVNGLYQIRLTFYEKGLIPKFTELLEIAATTIRSDDDPYAIPALFFRYMQMSTIRYNGDTIIIVAPGESRFFQKVVAPLPTGIIAEMPCN